MNKELLSAGKPYLWTLFYAALILFILIYLSGFRFLPIGIIFLLTLLIKCYAGIKLIINLIDCYLFKEKVGLSKKQMKINGAIVGALLLVDAVLLIHLPEVLKQTYTTAALMIFLLISGYCILNRWKSNYTVTYAPETAIHEIPFKQEG